MAAAAHAAVRKNKARPQGLAVDVEKVFDEFDHDGSGDMDLKELKTALKHLNINATDAQIQGLMERFASPNADSLEIATFNNLVQALRGKGNTTPTTPGKTPGKTSLTSTQDSARDPNEIQKPLKYPKLNRFCEAGENRLPLQRHVLKVYQHPIVVFTVAALIMANFLINIIEKEIDPSSVKYKETWESLDVAFNIIFLVELIVNIWSCGGPFFPFWRSGWNVFDFFIVMIGMILLGDSLPKSLSKLKLLRAFRIFRLFKRIKSLNKIVVAIIRSMPGVINAFVIMLIIFCIYAILAVDLFRDFGDNEAGTYTIWDSFEFANYSIPGDETSPATLGVFNYQADVSTLTARGMHVGSEYYGTFFRALFTLFQVMTGESWSEAVARPLLFGLDKSNGILVTIYYISFVLIMQFVLVNVVVAVLLDKFVADETPENDIQDDAVDSVLGGGGDAPASAPAVEPLREVQVRVEAAPAPAPSSVSIDQKLDLILGELASLKRDIAATKLELSDLKLAV